MNLGKKGLRKERNLGRRDFRKERLRREGT